MMSRHHLSKGIGELRTGADAFEVAARAYVAALDADALTCTAASADAVIASRLILLRALTRAGWQPSEHARDHMQLDETVLAESAGPYELDPSLLEVE